MAMTQREHHAICAVIKALSVPRNRFGKIEGDTTSQVELANIIHLAPEIPHGGLDRVDQAVMVLQSIVGQKPTSIMDKQSRDLDKANRPTSPFFINSFQGSHVVMERQPRGARAVSERFATEAEAQSAMNDLVAYPSKLRWEPAPGRGNSGKDEIADFHLVKGGGGRMRVVKSRPRAEKPFALTWNGDALGTFGSMDQAKAFAQTKVDDQGGVS